MAVTLFTVFSHENTAFIEPLPGACGKIGRVRSNLCDTKIGWKVNGLQVLGTFQERGFEVVEIRSQLNEPHGFLINGN